MTSHWYLQPIFDSYAVPLVLAGVLLALLLVRPAFQQVTSRQHRILRWLRLSVIGLVLMAMLRPTIVKTETRPLTSTLAVLVDASRSMQTEDMQDSSRWQATRELLEDNAAAFQSLAQSYQVKLFEFDKQARQVTYDDQGFGLTAIPEGRQTDIGAALDDVMRAEAGQRLGGVILLTDGAQRAVASRVDPSQAAKQLARLQCPIYAITLGRSRDQSQIRDIAVEDFEDQYRVFAKNEVAFRANIHAKGFVGQPIPVQLRVTKPDGSEEVLGPTTVVPEEANQSIGVSFNYIPAEPGDYQLLLQASEQPGERIKDNNQLGAFLQVLEGGINVLYLCGNIAWQEHNLVRRTIDLSQDIRLDFQWIDARRRDKWPIDLDKFLTESNYDVFVLADVDALALGSGQCKKLATLVEEGAGLLMTGGAHSFAAGGYARTQLANALPVAMNRFDRQKFNEPIRDDVHLNGDLQMLPTAPHFITRLSAVDDAGTWAALPPLRGANKLGKPKETAIVLAQTETLEPLLVQSQYGLGRVLAFAGDSTYRWYRYGQQDQHKRFWRQLILWLAKKDEQQNNDVHIQLAQRRYSIESPVSFYVRATDSLGEPIEDVRIDVELRSAAGGPPLESRIALTPEDGRWNGSTKPISAAGEYVLQATARTGNQVVGSTDAKFLVLNQDLELADPTANPSRMEMLASLTKEVGGRALPPDAMDELLQELQAAPPESTTEFQSRRQLADKPADSWGLLVGIVGLLTTEWFLRKKWDMV